MIIEVMSCNKARDMLYNNFGGFSKRYERALSFNIERDKLLSLAATFLIKKNFKNKTENDLYYNKNGKPFIKDGKYFSVSHSGEYAVFVKSKAEVGIDIEKIKDKAIAVSNKIFSESEKEYIKDSPERYYEIWTKKESFFKCLGTGISFPLNKTCVYSGGKNYILYNGIKYYFKTHYFNSHVITVCAASKTVLASIIRENL